jgi:putative hydrolase of the HAD superfamily
VAHEEVDRRHQLVFDSFERGFMTFEEYLRKVFLLSPYNFTLDEVRDYAYQASIPWPESIHLFRRVKIANKLGLGLISNEGEGIAQHRVNKFGLRELADFMVISHFTGLRKPDREIWRLALNLAQVSGQECVYVDDRDLFVDVASDLGFTAIHHTSIESTRAKLLQIGLSEEGTETSA